MAPSRRVALLIGVEKYDDGQFTWLPSCRADVWQLKQVLGHPAIGSFDSIEVVIDPNAAEMRRAITAFLDDAGPDDLALLYVSGHGSRLVASTGEFHFVARDTEYARLEATAVSASFVNEQLEASRAPQKITIIDACESGGFAVGLRTRDSKQARPAVLQSRGVHVLSSSRPGEASYAGPTAASGEPMPSVFTAEIIDALRTGRADGDGDGKVLVEDLFHDVSARLRARERDSVQIPVYSSVGVTAKIVIARVIAGAPIRLDKVPAEIPHASRPAAQRPPDTSGQPRTRADAWTRLLDYYQRCVRAESMDAPLLGIGDEGTRFVYLRGRERILSGGQNADDRVEIPEHLTDWLAEAARSEDELWAGYPAVLLYGRPHQRWSQPKFAPLLMRRVALVEDGGGRFLKPFGPAQPHPELADEWLGKDQAQHLVATYFATWHAGAYDQMVKDIRGLLDTEFELPTVEELRPLFLADTLDNRTPTNGARNVAVLFRATCKDKIVGGLLKDLAYIAEQPATIKLTALGAVLRQPNEPTETPPMLVTPLPCNEAQAAVIASAMTARLTVATGPPGTGKSQLVTNTVATAVSHGKTVLVTSTNNTAVDEVWQRCTNLVPGVLIRTGNPSYLQGEITALSDLAALQPPATNLATAHHVLTASTQRWHHIRDELRTVADLDRALLAAGRLREHAAAQLSWASTVLAAHLGDDRQTTRWQRRAERCARARLFARWRRQRLLHDLGHPGEPTSATCQHVAEAAAAQQRWATLRQDYRQVRTDSVLADELHKAEQDLRGHSAAVADTAVRAAAATGRQAIMDLWQAKTQRADGSGAAYWAVVKRALRAAVRGWAVSSLSARRFPTEAAMFDLVIVDEASQCSIPQILPLLFRAKRALVIGDPMQLPHISELTAQRDTEAHQAAGLGADWLDAHHLAYRRYSAFHALHHAAGTSLLLDEHYRCHPTIATVVNRLFYGGALTVLTDTRVQRHIDRPPIVWVPVAGSPTRPPHGQSWVNDIEATKVNDCVRFLLANLPADASVGVVTPYKAQADRLANQWRAEPRVRAGTVHTFQGGECDAIVLGLVAGPAMPASSVAWLEAQRNLWNVAISRARAHLIVVGDKEYWSRRRGIGADLAEASTASEDPPSEDPLVQRLYDVLASRYDGRITMAAPANGYRADALVQDNGMSTAILLDQSTASTDSARHLRLQYQRVELLRGPYPVNTAIRLPAWKLYEPELPALRPLRKGIPS